MMSRTIEHLCPNCREANMQKIINDTEEPYRVHDQSTMGTCTTVSVSGTNLQSTDFNASSFGNSGTFGFGGISSTQPPESLNKGVEIIFVGYECPKCKHRESFDE
jgi:phage FluMu protein Com